MQIFQWLSKKKHESPTVTNSNPVTKKQSVQDKKVEKKDIIVFSDNVVGRKRVKGVERTKLSCENLNIFYFLKRKDVSKVCFYHTLNLKKVGTNGNYVDPMKLKKDDIIRADHCATFHGGNKVLPVIETTQVFSKKNDSCECKKIVEKKENTKTKTTSRMKELLKWAATAKSENGRKYTRKVLSFRNKEALKAVPNNDDQFSEESPKISFKWDVSSCSISTSSVGFSTNSMDSSMEPDQVSDEFSMHFTPARTTGNWITSDSEFVVLEL